MKIIEYYRPNEDGYHRAAAFATRIYQDKLNFSLAHFPEFFFTIEEDGRVLGCIGLNLKLRCPLFLGDPVIVEYVANIHKDNAIGEQSILAVEGYPPGIVLLVSAFAECAYYLGLDIVLFAGTSIALRTFTHIGVEIATIKKADEFALPPEERANYRLWFDENVPMVCAIPTQHMLNAAPRVFTQYRNKVALGPKLAEVRRARVNR